MRMCIACLVLFAVAAIAHAEEPIGRPNAPDALEHLAKGNKLYNVRSFEDAASEYKAGALVEPAPIFDYNLGQCYRQLGRYKDAIWHYERFLKSSPGTGERAEAIHRFIAQMQAELDKKAMTEPPTEPAPPPAQVPIWPTRGPSSARAETPEAPAPWYKDKIGWGLTGAGAIAAGVSIGLLVDAGQLNDDANHASSQSDANRLHDKADSRTLLGTLVGIGGVGLLATGVIKLMIHARPERAASAQRTCFDVSPTGVGILVLF